MTDGVVIAIVTTIGLIVVAFISNRGRQHAKAARAQVENSHSTNFREEFDQRHEENTAKLDTLVTWQGQHKIHSMKRDARITRVEVLLLPTIIAAMVNTVIHIIRKR